MTKTTRMEIKLPPAIDRIISIGIAVRHATQQIAIIRSQAFVDNEPVEKFFDQPSNRLENDSGYIRKLISL